MSKLVSVIIPTYKGIYTIEKAINSVLIQTYQNFEIIIVDDNGIGTICGNQTKKIIRQYNNKKIKYIQHKSNQNGAYARNTGINASQGDFVTFLDDDDYFERTRLEKCVYQLKKYNEYDGVYTSVNIVKNNKIINIIKAKKSGSLSEDLLLNENLFGTGSNLFLTRKSVKQLGGFNVMYTRNQDYEFMLRFFRQFKIINYNEALVNKTLGGTNIPTVKKYITIKKMIYNDFKNEINLLSEQKKTMLLSNTLNTLLNSAYLYQSMSDIVYVESLFNKYGVKIGIKNRIRKIFLKFGIYKLIRFK
ncbi:glycosyltransferase family 2 protein [Massilimicrobiota timonensis]|uniref:Glycosyltransferase 2-like domain-containing protein n=1 Tax=Massilimicrobiota timonensis TaxID=1776392 RepID=A0A1Y4STH7_9FIRM|nr:glycosyltransferase family A protein [Massilimicrobiota timonensis]OUQ33208.1 hypothetical protein B5E75_11105 [Massilimicrobiota timonensis]